MARRAGLLPAQTRAPHLAYPPYPKGPGAVCRQRPGAIYLIGMAGGGATPVSGMLPVSEAVDW